MLSELLLGVLLSGVTGWATLLQRRLKRRTQLLSERDRELDSLREIETIREATEAACQAKIDFLANFSHEIRTPLNGIAGMAELSLDHDMSPELRNCLEVVMRSTDSLRAIVNDILEFSKMENGTFSLRPRPFSVRRVVEHTLRLMTPEARKANREIVSDVSSGVPELVIGDSIVLEQVIGKLIRNALQDSGSGEIEIRVWPEQQDSDGISLHFLISEKGAVETPGMGKGGSAPSVLSLECRLAALMNGRIWTGSEAGQGRGLHLAARFGKAAVSEEPAASPARIACAAAERVHAGGRAARVLVAEDNPMNQLMIRTTLRRRGFEVVLAENGRLALEALEKEPFAAVFMDIQMPELDGLSATEEIRRREAGTGRRQLIIALTAHSLPSDRKKCLDAGMDEYLAKPVKPYEIISTLDRLLEAGVGVRPEPASDELASTYGKDSF